MFTYWCATVRRRRRRLTTNGRTCTLYDDIYVLHREEFVCIFGLLRLLYIYKYIY